MSGADVGGRIAGGGFVPGDLDEALWAAFGTTPSPEAGTRMDARVQAAIARRAAEGRVAGLPARPRLRSLRWPHGRWGRPLALLLAGAIVAGAGAAYVELFEPMLGPVQGWHLAWERAARPAIVESAGPYTLELERVYADANQVFLGVSVAEASGATPVEIGPDVALTDSLGREYQPYFVSGNPGGNALGLLIGFQTPAPLAAGPIDLTLTLRLEPSANAQLVGPSPGATFTPMPGPVTFRFGADVAGGGAIVRPTEGTVTAAGYTLALDPVSISPTMVRTRLHVSGPPLDNMDPIVTFTADGRSFPVMASVSETVDGTLVFDLASVEGLTHPGGRATITVDRLMGGPSGSSPSSITGPWQFSLWLPGR